MSKIKYFHEDNFGIVEEISYEEYLSLYAEIEEEENAWENTAHAGGGHRDPVGGRVWKE